MNTISEWFCMLLLTRVTPSWCSLVWLRECPILCTASPINPLIETFFNGNSLQTPFKDFRSFIFVSWQKLLSLTSLCIVLVLIGTVEAWYKGRNGTSESVPYIRLSLISELGCLCCLIAHDTYQLRHCCIASYLFYHLILSELRFYFVIEKILII